MEVDSVKGKTLYAEVVKDPVWSNWNSGRAVTSAKVGLMVENRFGRKGTIVEVDDEWSKVKWEDGEIQNKYIGTGFCPNHTELFTKVRWGQMKKVWVVTYKSYAPSGLASGFISSANVFDTKEEVDQFMSERKPFMPQILETFYTPTI